MKLAAADGTRTTTGTYATPPMTRPVPTIRTFPPPTSPVIGHYQYTWTSTGTGAGVSFGDFDVFDPFEPALLPLPTRRTC